MQTDDEEEKKPQHQDAIRVGPVSRWAVLRSVFGTLVSLSLVTAFAVAALAVFHPDSPLPRHWNLMKPLMVTDPVTPLTSWKLRRTLNNPQQCLLVLEEATQTTRLDPFEATENCHIRNRVRVAALQTSDIEDIETSCATALRLAMWEVHGVQPAAVEILGSQVSVFRQIGSYNCRPIRTSQGNAARWSTHSTADAIDITGFDLADGRRIRLIDDWEGDLDEAAFLRAVRDSACKWFATTLGPDYNALHADHFHLQAYGWGTCR